MLTVDFERLGLQAGDKVLDVGCGEGRHCIGAFLESDVQVIGVDIGQKDLQTAQEKAQPFIDANASTQRSLSFQLADALNLPFPDESFDKVMCSEVLEHIPDYQGVLAEINRVLKPDGKLVVSVPRAWPEEICWNLSTAYRKVEGGHIRIFNAVQLKNDIEDLGWNRIDRHWAHALHVPYWWLKCWNWGTPDDDVTLIRWYHKLLVWDMMERPWLTRSLEWLLNPLMGKSVVMYFERSKVYG